MIVNKPTPNEYICISSSITLHLQLSKVSPGSMFEVSTRTPTFTPMPMIQLVPFVSFYSIEGIRIAAIGDPAKVPISWLKCSHNHEILVVSS
jgi:hypothetical protein